MNLSGDTGVDMGHAKRNVAVLVAAQAVVGAQMPVNFIIGGLAGQSLAPNACMATLPISTIILGSALTARPLARYMQMNGRRAGFMLAVMAGTLGATISAAALWFASFWLLLLGGLLTGVYMSAQGFFRFAATDTAPPEFEAKAISWVMAGGLAAAIVGPAIARMTDNLGPIPFIGGYIALIVVNLLGLGLFAFLDIPKPPPPRHGDVPARTMGQLLRQPVIIVAMTCAMVSYALMNLVMTSTPLAVVGCGFVQDDAANIVSAHVLAMYAPSFVTGYLINRFGTTRIVGTGIALLAAGGVVALTGVQLTNFFGTLILLGFGWNFGFIGATAMLARAHNAAERGRVQGMNDLVVFSGVFVASLSSGGLMNCLGGSPQAGWYAVNLAMLPFLLLAAMALIWLTMHNRRTVSRAS